MGAASGSSRTSSTVLRLLAVAALTGASTAALAVPPALADSATPAVVKTNWYWSLTSPSVEGNTVPVAVPAPASTVPDGDLGVGYVADQAGTADKVAALGFDLAAIPLGSTFSSFEVSVPYDPAAHQAASGTPDISACELIDGFADAPGPSDLKAAPPVSQPSCVKGAYKATVGSAGGYVFDLTAIANDWSGGAPAEGVLLQPTQGLATPQQPFSLSFLGKNGITTAVSYAPPATDQPEPVAPPAAVVPPPPLPGFAPQPQVQPVALPAVPPAPVPVPQVQPVPTTVPLQAVRYAQGPLVPDTRWWLAVLGLLALLGLTSVVLGDPMAPVVVERRRRFAEAIRTGSAPRPAASPVPRPRHA